MFQNNILVKTYEFMGCVRVPLRPATDAPEPRVLQADSIHVVDGVK